MKKALIILTFLIGLGTTTALAQDRKCDCCTYSSLEFRQDFEEIMPPKTIKKKGIKEVVIHILGQEIEGGKSASKQTLESSFEEEFEAMVLQFGSSGLVSSKTDYNSEGKADRTWVFKRNEAKKISKQTFNYLDSLGRPTTFFPPEIIDFIYDSKGRLIKRKERDSDGEILPDKTAHFSNYEYDEKGRITKEIRQYYYDGSEPSIYTTSFKYFGDSTSTYKTDINGELFISGKAKYNKSGRLLAKEEFNNLVGKKSNEEFWQYDSQGRILVFETKSGAGSVSECPDGGTYKDEYLYGISGLVDEIIHSYGNYTCIIKFDYRK